MKILFLGSTGYIASYLIPLLKDHSVVPSKHRLDDLSLKVLKEEVEREEPDAIISCAGLTGRPNVDWCEDNKHEVIRVNLLGTLSLMEYCEGRGLYLINMATGCIFEYSQDHPEPFGEKDIPNFDGSFYSLTKGFVDRLAHHFSHVLTLRLRMPITGDSHPRCFITKIRSYEKVVDVPNSMSVLPTLLPAILDFLRDKPSGTLNYVNPGVISHNEILEMYKEICDPSFSYTNFTLKEQAAILKAGRSNNALTTSMLQSLTSYTIPSIHEAVRSVLK